MSDFNAHANPHFSQYIDSGRVSDFRVLAILGDGLLRSKLKLVVEALLVLLLCADPADHKNAVKFAVLGLGDFGEIEKS